MYLCNPLDLIMIYREDVLMQPICTVALSTDPIIYFRTPDMKGAARWPRLPDYLDLTQQAVAFDQASKERKAETSNREPGHGPTPSEPRTTTLNRLASNSESAGPDSGCVVHTRAPYGGHAACVTVLGWHAANKPT